MQYQRTFLLLVRTYLRSFWVLFALLGACWANAATVREVRVWPAPDHTRVVFDLDKPASHKLLLLSNPDRLVVDIAKSSLSKSDLPLALGQTPIKRMRHAKQPNGDLRIVLDLKHTVKQKSFLLKKNKQADDRLVLDLYSPAATKQQKQKLKKQAPNPKRDIVVAIDAGHGGEDPGALGPRKIREKNVVLAIAKALAKRVNQVPGYKAVLIRNGDYYIGLQQRWKKARQYRADLFVSIHADAFTNRKANGSSVYALSNRSGTSAAAKFLAQAANNSDEIGGIDLQKNDVLSSVLVDLSLTHKMEASTNVGAKVLSQMGKISRLHSSRVERAGFAVLKSPDIPSILVETGFISNPREARNLNSSSYQKKMANAIFKGLNAYFQHQPPAGTLIAWQQRNKPRIYRVVSGDSLSVIAKRFQVSVRSIRRQNALKNDAVKIGQRIMIPAS